MKRMYCRTNISVVFFFVLYRQLFCAYKQFDTSKTTKTDCLENENRQKKKNPTFLGIVGAPLLYVGNRGYTWIG